MNNEIEKVHQDPIRPRDALHSARSLVRFGFSTALYVRGDSFDLCATFPFTNNEIGTRCILDSGHIEKDNMTTFDILNAVDDQIDERVFCKLLNLLRLRCCFRQYGYILDEGCAKIRDKVYLGVPLEPAYGLGVGLCTASVPSCNRTP